MKLFIYEHCPFCIRARMIFGLKQVPLELNVILEGDIETPTKLVGRKVVPIIQKTDGTYMPESMDIVNYVDELSSPKLLIEPADKNIEEWCRNITRTVFNLAIPRFTKADFAELNTTEARKAYTEREIKAFGNLDELIARTDEFTHEVIEALKSIEDYLANKDKVTLTDFYLFPVLNSLTIVKDFPFTPALNHYLHTVSQACNVPVFINKAI